MNHPRLQRLRIHRYEQFIAVPWIEFSAHENLILGINGAGKTRLLQLIRAVLSFKYDDLLAQDFDVEFEIAYPAAEPGEVALHGRVRSEEAPAVSGPKDPESIGERRQLATKITLTAGAHQIVFRTERAASTLTLDGKDVPVAGTLQPGHVIPWDDVRAAKHPHMPALLPGFSAFYVHEDDRDFRTLLERVQFSLPSRPERRFAVEDTGGLPAMLAFTLIRSLAALGDSAAKREGIRLGGQDFLPDLAPKGLRTPVERLLTPLGAQSLLLRPKVRRETAEMLECHGFEVRVRFAPEVEYTDLGLTFGQRRFLMMALFLLFRPSFPILIDEIDNGFHPRLVEATLQLLAGRQSFLASHNKTVVDYVNYENAEDIRRKLHVCRRDADGSQTVTTLDEATAQEVHDKLSVGIMHPSDVLLVEGLW